MDEIDKAFSQIQKNRAKKEEKKKEKAEKRQEETYSVREASLSEAPAYTEDGYRMCTEKELKLGKSKNTPECPFDCDCCF